MTTGAGFFNLIGLEYRADTEQFQKSIDAASAKLDGFIKSNRTVGDLFGTLKDKLVGTSATAALFGGAIIGAGVALKKIVTEAADYGNELQKISNRTGESVESLSRLQFAAEQEDASLQEVAGSLRIVSRQADAAARGSKEAQAAFKRLGVDVKDADGKLKSGGQLLREIGEGLSRIPPGTERTAAGMKVLGRSAQAIIPLVTNLKELDAQAERLGLTVSGQFARNADDFGDKLDQIRAISRRAGVAIAEALLPTLNKFLGILIEDLIPALEALKKVMDAAGVAIRFLADGFLLLETGPKRVGVALARLAKGDIEGARSALRNVIQDFSDVKNQSDETAGAVDDLATSTKTALELLADQFKAVKPDVEQLIKTAEDLGDGFTLVNPQFDELIGKLEVLAKTSDDAAKALAGVLTLREEGAAALNQITEDQTAERIQRGLTTRRIQGPETAAGALPEQAGVAGEALQAAPKLLEDSATFAEKLQAALTAGDLAAAALNTTLTEGQAALAGFTQLADGFGDAIISAAEGGKTAFSDFFKGLLKDLARAIVRATILQAILGVFGGGFSLAKIGKSVQQALGFLGFAHQESSILGRASQARGIEAVAGPSFAGGGTENVMTLAKAPNVVVHEPGPFTVVEMTDRGVVPRIRARQRKLNEEAF